MSGLKGVPDRGKETKRIPEFQIDISALLFS
jgi:hypothetical protein